MPEFMYGWRWKIAACVAVWMSATGVAMGQANLVARRGSEITPFGGFTYVQPDWGAYSNAGLTVGADITPYIPLRVQPSLELRFSNAGGVVNTERTFSGGLKLAVRFAHVHPYGIFEEGLGIIYFKHPTINPLGTLYKEDASRIYVAGGGAEYDVHNLWQMRVEFTQQYWNLKPPTLEPITASIGVTYRIPFRKGKMK